MNVIIKRIEYNQVGMETMNTINEVEVLRALLHEPSKSIYSLEKHLEERFSKQNLKVNYPTLRRRVNKLVNDGFIEEEKGKRKDGRVDQRKTKNLSLSFKGLVFLILKADLDESESRVIVQRILLKPQYRKFYVTQLPLVQQIPIVSIHKSFKQIRPRVNLEYFEEEYVQGLLFENLIIENVLSHIIEWKKRFFKDLSDRKLKHLVKKVRKDVDKLPAEWVQMMFSLYDYLRSKREIWNEKIMLLKPIVREFRKRGFRYVK